MSNLSYPKSVGTKIDLSGSLVTLSEDGGVVLGAYTNTVIGASHVTIRNSDGSQSLVIPTDTPAGTSFQFFGMQFDDSLVVDPGGPNTGELVLFWRKA